MSYAAGVMKFVQQCTDLSYTHTLIASTWPYLHSDGGLEEGAMLTELSLCYSILHLASSAQ